MKLSEFDGKFVRIETEFEGIFEGECQYENKDYCECEIGITGDALSIDRWFFTRKDIRRVSVVEPNEEIVWMNRLCHRMMLDEKLYELMESGKKTVEVRLYDEKRQRIRAGDIIRFENRGDDTDVEYVLVETVAVYPSFRELFENVRASDCGLGDDPEGEMGRYYTEAEQQRYQAAAYRFHTVPED